MKKEIITIVLGFGMAGAYTFLHAEGDHNHTHDAKHGNEVVEVNTDKIKDSKPSKEADIHAGMDHGNAHWASPKEAALRKNPIESSPESIARGSNSYQLLCTSCHGAEGLGDGPAAKGLDPKPTNLKAMSGGHEDGDFAWKIANGRGAMPAWKGILSEDQIWDMVNFIQNLKNSNTSKGDDHNGHTH